MPGGTLPERSASFGLRGRRRVLWRFWHTMYVTCGRGTVSSLTFGQI